MEIKYLQKMQKTRTIDGYENEGVSEKEIEKIEDEIGKKFPTVYREFLFLGGKEANMLLDISHRIQSSVDDEEYWQETQEKCKKEVAEMNVKMEKDYWVFADDGGEEFHFFYFDEEDDPKVYHYCSDHFDDDGNMYAGIMDIGKTFSEYINNRIDVAKERGWS